MIISETRHIIGPTLFEDASTRLKARIKRSPWIFYDNCGINDGWKNGSLVSIPETVSGEGKSVSFLRMRRIHV